MPNNERWGHKTVEKFARAILQHGIRHNFLQQKDTKIKRSSGPNTNKSVQRIKYSWVTRSLNLAFPRDLHESAMLSDYWLLTVKGGDHYLRRYICKALYKMVNIEFNKNLEHTINLISLSAWAGQCMHNILSAARYIIPYSHSFMHASPPNWITYTDKTK